jgi:hypothetical protein
MISSVLIQVIPHEKQRYETVGDWELIGNALKISVSDTGNWLYNMAIGLHELVEALICHHRGISQEKVDNFDTLYEKRRKDGNIDEPGDDPKAPYHLEHGFASSAERMLIAACGVNWKEYEETWL